MKGLLEREEEEDMVIVKEIKKNHEKVKA